MQLENGSTKIYEALSCGMHWLVSCNMHLLCT